MTWMADEHERSTEPQRVPSLVRLAAPYLALIAIVLAVYAEPLVTGRVFFYRDLGLRMRPVLAQARAGPAGHAEALPLWTHAVSNGRPLVANPGYSLLEPLNVLFRVLPFDRAFNFFLVLHVAIAACAMAFLARRLGCSRAASFAAGGAYALGGGLVSGLTLYWTAVAAAWAPLVVAAGWAAVEESKIRYLALLALAIGLQAIGGQPEPVAATLLVGIVTSFVWARGSAARRTGLVLVTWIGGIVGGLALAAPQLLPAALHARTTLRAMGFTAEGLLYNSLHPRRALWLVVPGLGGNPIEALEPGGFPGAALLDGSSPYLLSIYLGIVTFGLALAALVLSRRRPTARPLAFALAGLVVLGVAMASGRYVPGASTLLAALPFPIPFRYPEKALFVTFLAIAPLAALGIDAMRTFRVPRLPILLAAAVVLDLVLAHRGYAPTIDLGDLATPPLARELRERSRALGVPDALWRVHHQRQRDSGGWGPPVGSVPPTEEDFYRWQVRMLVPPIGAPYVHAAMEVAGDQLDDLRYFALVRTAYNAPPETWALALGEAGVLWVVSPQPDLEAATSRMLVREIVLGPAEGLPAGSGYVYRNTRFVPRARLTTDVTAIPVPSLGELAAMARRRYEGSAPWPPTSVVEAERDAVLELQSGPGEPGSIASFTEDHRGLTLSVAADRPAVLVISDVPGTTSAWRSRIDGEPAPVWRANLAYLVVPVPPGRHEVRLDYRPPGLQAGVVTMLVALLACAAALWPRRHTESLNGAPRVPARPPAKRRYARRESNPLLRLNGLALLDWLGRRSAVVPEGTPMRGFAGTTRPGDLRLNIAVSPRIKRTRPREPPRCH